MPKTKRPLVSKRPPKPRSESALAEQFERTTGRSADERPKEYRAFRAQQRGESNGNGTRSDDAPRTPQGSPRVAVGRRVEPKAMKGLDRRMRRFLRLGTANPRQVLMLELVAVLAIVTVDSLAHREAPSPRAYLAPFIVYLILGFAAEIGGDGAARVATGLGALILVALVLANAPGIVRALAVVSGQRQAPVEGVG